MLESTYDFDFTSIPTNPESTHNISEPETPESRCGSHHIDPWPKGKPVWPEYDSPSSPTKIRRGVTSRMDLGMGRTSDVMSEDLEVGWLALNQHDEYDGSEI
jgi:hypothetical protein